VLRIRYEIGEDWSGQWALFFRIVFSEDAARRRLRAVASTVDWELAQRLDFVGMGVSVYHNFRSESEQAALQEPAWASDDLLTDARDSATRGNAENRSSCMRRSISTAYYAVFHMLGDDFVSQWPFVDQRPRLGPMFDHQKMREAPIVLADQKNWR